MSFQKCPICSGTGQNPNTIAANDCKTCNGTGIINELTGLPPHKPTTESFEELEKKRDQWYRQ